MSDNEKKFDFIKEQYSQYWEMKRLYLSFSWQIPALAVVATVAFIGLDQDKLISWYKAPLITAINLLVIGLFVGVMFIHHRRNLIFANKLSRAIAELEKKFGIEMDVHHHQVQLKGWQRISSSTSLSVFLFSLMVILLGTSIYFLVIALV
jgi:hypothetical protein